MQPSFVQLQGNALLSFFHTSIQYSREREKRRMRPPSRIGSLWKECFLIALPWPSEAIQVRGERCVKEFWKDVSSQQSQVTVVKGGADVSVELRLEIKWHIPAFLTQSWRNFYKSLFETVFWGVASIIALRGASTSSRFSLYEKILAGLGRRKTGGIVLQLVNLTVCIFFRCWLWECFCVADESQTNNICQEIILRLFQKRLSLFTVNAWIEALHSYFFFVIDYLPHCGYYFIGCFIFAFVFCSSPPKSADPFLGQRYESRVSPFLSIFLDTYRYK